MKINEITKSVTVIKSTYEVFIFPKEVFFSGKDIVLFFDSFTYIVKVFLYARFHIIVSLKN